MVRYCLTIAAALLLPAGGTLAQGSRQFYQCPEVYLTDMTESRRGNEVVFSGLIARLPQTDPGRDRLNDQPVRLRFAPPEGFLPGTSYMAAPPVVVPPHGSMRLPFMTMRLPEGMAFTSRHAIAVREKVGLECEYLPAAR